VSTDQGPDSTTPADIILGLPSAMLWSTVRPLLSSARPYLHARLVPNLSAQLRAPSRPAVLLRVPCPCSCSTCATLSALSADCAHHSLPPSQLNGLVPIVEPEVTLGPGDYSIEETAFWSERVYSHVMRLLNEYGVVLEGILLKPNMCLPGTCGRSQEMGEGVLLRRRWAGGPGCSLC
jgi:hypothetical protein